MRILGSQLGNLFTDIFGAIGGFFDTVGLVFNAVLDSIFAPIWQILYYLFIGIAQIARFAEAVFRKVAGLDTIYLNGAPVGGASSIGSGAGNTGGLVIAFLTHDTVYKMLIAIIIFSVVLLFLTTIIAIIKAEFAIDVKGSAKGPIIGRALKSLAMFFIVPIVTVLGIYLTNIITLAADKLLSNGQSGNIVNRCFEVGAVGANRGRNNSEIAGYWARGLSPGWSPDYVDSAFMRTGSSNPERMPVINLLEDGSWALNSGWAGAVGDIGALGTVPGLQAAAGLAGLFKLGYAAIGTWFGGSPAIEGSIVANLHAFMVPMPYAGTELTFYNYYQVNYFYCMSDFDYILSIGTALVMAWLLLSTCLTLLKRVFEITMLMLLAPPMIALAPLDNGQAQKKWTGEMLKRVISVIGPVFAFNMYFLLVPLFDGITLFGSVISVSSTLSVGAAQMGMPFLAGAAVAVIAYDIFFQLITVITGLIIVKQASALISALLGVEDLVKSGLDASKKAVAVGAQAVTMAIGGAGLAVKGASALMKVGGKATRGINKAIHKKKANNPFAMGNKEQDMNTAKDERDKAQKDYDRAEEVYNAYDRMEVDPESKGFEEYLTKKAAAKADMDSKKEILEGKQDAFAEKEADYKGTKVASDLYDEGYTAWHSRKAGAKITEAQKRDKRIKDAQKAFAAKGDSATLKDQYDLDDEIAAANRDYNKSKAGGVAGSISSFFGGLTSPIGNFISRGVIGQSFRDEFGKNASGASVFAGSKHMDKSSQLMFRMVLDNWVGMMGGKEDGAGLIVRRALEKTERERFFYAGKENKQLELKREQGLLMAERAKSEENMRKDAEKNKEKDALRTMLQDQGLSGKELEEAFFNAWTRIQQGKGVSGFDDYKKKADERAKSDAQKEAISRKIEANNVDIKAKEAVDRSSEHVKGSVKIDENSITSMTNKLKEALKTVEKNGNKELADKIKSAIQSLESAKAGTTDDKILAQLVKTAQDILSKIK